jgi:hypothetical protein
MKFRWRKWFRIIHRDLGYFFVATTIVYAVSGIAINHLNDWNPNYIIESKKFKADVPSRKEDIFKQDVMNILKQVDEEDNYKKHYFPNNSKLKIFIDGGSLVIELNSGKGICETIRRRPVFHLFNYLHYNPGKWWVWYADAYAVALFIFAITGLFMVKGRKGFKWRGLLFAIAGIIIPLIYILIYY